MKRPAAAFLLFLILLVAIIVGRAARVPTRQIPPPVADATFVPSPGAVERLAGAIRFPTVTTDNVAERHDEPFNALVAYLADRFPTVHRTLEHEAIGRNAQLYTWRGSDPALKPVVLMGHLDVVPVEPGTEGEWHRPPFGGELSDGFLWGRGALDDKVTVLGLLEATETLASRGWRPRRTLLLAFGADEEGGGLAGAAAIAEQVRARYGTVDFVVDEGGAILPPGIIPGVSAPVAVIGIAEKGFVNVELRVDSEGGHSSTPPRPTAVGSLARAVAALEDRPMPASLRGAAAELFDHLTPEMPFRLRVIFANRWLFSPLILRVLSRSPSTDATIRTTTAATIFEGSPKGNVLAAHPRAVVNFRILPGDSVESVVEHVRQTVRDPDVHVRTIGAATQPSPVSSTTSENWRLVERTMRQIFPDVLVAPYLVLGGTDSRHFAGMTTDVYRLLPVRFPPEGVRLVHGTNERIATTAYQEAIRFYGSLIESATR